MARRANSTIYVTTKCSGVFNNWSKQTVQQAVFRNGIRAAHGEIFTESCSSKPNLDFSYNFPIDLAPNRIPLMLNLSEKCNYNPNLNQINQILKRYLCVKQTVFRNRIRAVICIIIPKYRVPERDTYKLCNSFIHNCLVFTLNDAWVYPLNHRRLEIRVYQEKLNPVSEC